MDFHSNLEYLCRVCAANTKGKNSGVECAYILKTPGLKDKLDKFLYLKIAENDNLPKVLCKSCFRQVEATASLSKIAKHTQQVFRDFLLSNLPKSSSDPVNTSELISSDFLGNNDSEKSSKNNVAVPPPVPNNSLTQLPTVQVPVMVSAPAPIRKDEVIVNVSVSDPLTRDNQLKMISNSQRRQSILVEAPPRYTPKSIAQLPMAPPRSMAPKAQTMEAPPLLTTTNNQNNVMPLNYSPVKQQQQQQTPQPPQQPQPQQQQQQQHQVKQQLPAQVTTFTSGGYVIGRLNTGSNEKKEPKKSTLPLAPAPDNVLQQKRKNLVKALNNIKANNSGQVSLLKSSQQKQQLPTQITTKTPLAEVVNQAAEDELPDKIIIAAPKKKSPEKSKKEPLNLSSKLPPPKPAQTKAVVNTVVTVPAPEKPVTYNPPPPPPAATASKPTFPEDILLGRVIRDMDLLKLILKALQWPVTKQNMDAQIQRLKSSKFTDIMSDSNLLQDTDLTQLLGPYLAPVLLAAQALQQQQHQILHNTALNQNMSAAYITQKSPPSMDIQAQAEINQSMPYKLPPETSVQLVPATPEEQEASKSPPLPLAGNSSSSYKRDRQKESKQTSTVPVKRQRRTAAQKARDSIVISDEDDEDNQPLKKPSKQRQSTKSTPNVQLQLNPNIISQLGMLSGGSGGDEANEALLALLNRQKDAISKQQNLAGRRRNSVSNIMTLPASEFDALIDLDDDIVLMEPVTTTSSDSLSSSLGQTPQPQKDHQAFIIPSRSLITRPIIKRRKTVIQTSRGRNDLIIDLNNEDQTNQMNLNVYNKNQPPNVETQPMQQHNTDLTKTTPTNLSLLQTNTLTGPPKSTIQQKKLQNKAALGQQLLEAIGLQQAASNSKHNSTQSELATSSTPIASNNKQSIQQIRSALKKSLKQAQEIQRQRQKESCSAATSSHNTSTIIQDADSTTKPSVKEILVVEGKGNKSDNCSSSLVDVEDQIDKVTLMVRKNEKLQQPSSNLASSSASDKNEKKEGKKLAERRRTVAVAAPVRNARSLLLESAKLIQPVNTVEEIKVTKIVEIQDNDKLEKEDNEILNISSSSAATMPISIADSLTSSEMNQTKDEEVPTPKRRGRKRLVDKLAEAKAIQNGEKEKEDIKQTALSERSRTFDITKDEEANESLKSKDEDGETNTKADAEGTTGNKTSGRPTRQSKAQSKYYKGPDQPTQGRRSLPSRSTRNR